jgi:V/A-type H+-transporting ATPase subunit A
VILQQDAFDNIDGCSSLERQKFMLDLILEICDRSFKFDNFEECMTYFKDLINICRQMNYSEYESEQFNKYMNQLKEELKHE